MSRLPLSRYVEYNVHVDRLTTLSPFVDKLRRYRSTREHARNNASHPNGVKINFHPNASLSCHA